MKAMILASGLGSRLGALTNVKPKCLLEIGGKPVLLWVIERLYKAGVTEVCINLFHLADQVTAFIASTNLPVRVTFSAEPQLFGTGGGLLHARQHFQGGEPFFVHNADIFSDIDLKALWLAQVSDPGRIATLAVLPRQTSKPLYFSAEGLLEGWGSSESKVPFTPTATSQSFGFCGVQVVSPEIFDYMDTTKSAFSIIEPYLAAVQAGRRVVNYRVEGSQWVDIGTPERLTALRKRVEEPLG